MTKDHWLWLRGIRTAVVGLLILTGCDRGARVDGGRPAVGVTTSYLECAVCDVAPGRFRIVRLLPPGGCPGHFDVTPKMIDRLRGSALLLRFDFQESLDAKLERLKASGLTVMPVPIKEGMTIPETYECVCRTVCDALCKRWPAEAPAFRSRLEAIARRLDRLSDEGRRRVAAAGLGGTKVLSSAHQSAFCTWLDLKVVGTYPRGEAALISEITETLENGQQGRVKLVVGNLQEGLRVAQRLSGHLGVPMVVFSNFPSMAENQKTFDDLFWANVGALVTAAGLPPATRTSTRPTTARSTKDTPP